MFGPRDWLLVDCVFWDCEIFLVFGENGVVGIGVGFGD